MAVLPEKNGRNPCVFNETEKAWGIRGGKEQKVWHGFCIEERQERDPARKVGETGGGETPADPGPVTHRGDTGRPLNCGAGNREA